MLIVFVYLCSVMKTLILIILTLLNIGTPADTSEGEFHLYQINFADSLYKNYQPQHNFVEVKAAMEYFDSIQMSATIHQHQDNEYQRLCDSLSFICAKAHYYYAIGLSEKDDITGACEHHLHALEVMEELMMKNTRRKEKVYETADAGSSDTINPQEYEKIRFIALIYNRLGRLFYNAGYCDLAIIQYKNALIYLGLIEEIDSQSYIFKELGNTYHLYGKADSALYYYNKSLEISSNLANRLDIEKCVAKILFENGEKDSAYILLKNNLDKIENYRAKGAYYWVLGEMYYKDMVYDSAIVYLELSMNSSNSNVNLAASNYLSNIYKLQGDFDSKNYYDSISILHLCKHNNKTVEFARMSYVYNNHIKNKNTLNKTEEKDTYIFFISATLLIIICMILITTIKFHNYRKKINDKENEIETKEKSIKIINNTNKDLQNQNEELIKAIHKHKRADRNNIRNYRNSDNSKKILANIENIKKNNLKINNINPLTTEELSTLLDDADMYLDNCIQKLSNKYPKLKKDDLYCICLLLLNISEPTIAALLDKSYNTIWSRINKIRSIIKIKSNINLYDIIK